MQQPLFDNCSRWMLTWAGASQRKSHAFLRWRGLCEPMLFIHRATR